MSDKQKCMGLEMFHRFVEVLRSGTTIPVVNFPPLCCRGILAEHQSAKPIETGYRDIMELNLCWLKRRKEEKRRQKLQSTEKCLQWTLGPFRSPHPAPPSFTDRSA